MEEYGRVYLKKGQEILLSHNEDGRAPEIYTIQSVIGEGGSSVCYEATRRRSGCVETGKLKEFYPIDAATGENPWCSLERLESGQLVPCRGTVRKFDEMCADYVDAYRELRNTISENPDNEILKNYIQHGDILYGCMKADKGIAGGGEKKKKRSLAVKAAEDERRATVYVWTPGEKGKTFAEYLDDVRRDPAVRPDHTLYDILTTVIAITDSIRAMHTAGLLHLDIKPSNFLVSYYSNFRINPNRVSIFDINTLHVIGADLPYISGTRGYTAPELLRGMAINRTDIYSIGAMLFNAIVISKDIPESLYDDGYYGNIDQIVRHSELISGSESNSDVRLMSLLARILKQCLAENPTDRYRSCSALMNDLKTAAERIRQHTVVEREHKGKTDPTVVMQKLLYKYPLYKGIEPGDSEMNVLVVGAGTYGQKFADICLQAGQIKDVRLNIRMVSNSPEEDAELYMQFRPALTEFVNVCVGDKVVSSPEDSYGTLMFTSVGTDSGTGEASAFSRGDNENNAALVKRLMDEICAGHKRYNYVFVALGNDRLNKSVASLFADEKAGCPVCYVTESLKKQTKAEAARMVIPVPVNEEITPETIDTRLEQMAFNAHISWNSSLNMDISEEYRRFRENRYNYASSMAYALSVKYKLFSVNISVDNDFEAAAKRFNDEILAVHDSDAEAHRKYISLIALEHKRWVMNYVTAGWTAPRDRNGNIRYADFAAMGRDKDEAKREHVCIVHSTEEMPLCSAEYSENDHAKWNAGEIDPSLDELDRVSVEMHRRYLAAANEYRALQPFKGEDMQHLTGLLADKDESVVRAFRQFGFCLKNILNGMESYSRQFGYYKDQFVRTLHNLPAHERDDILRRLDMITDGFKPVIAANLYKDYKLNDVVLIQRIPFIMTYHTQSSVAMAFEDGRYQNGRNEAVFANVASATLLSPAKICYLYNFNADSTVELLTRKLRAVMNYLDTRNVHTEITMLIALRPGDERAGGQLRDALDELRERTSSEVENAVFREFVIIPCTDESDAVAKLVSALEDRNIDLYDGTGKLFESQLNNGRLVSALLEKGAGYFELDRKRKYFSECVGCEYLRYMNDDSYIRINDVFALMNAAETGFNIPEFADDYETLWNIYTSKDEIGQTFEASVANWNRLCGALSAYEDQRRPMARFIPPHSNEVMNEHSMFLAEFAFNKASYIIERLKEYGIIGKESCVSGYTSDTCRVDVVATDITWQKLKAAFAQQHLFIGYYGMDVMPVQNDRFGAVDMRCHALKVANLELNTGEANSMLLSMHLLRRLEKANFITQLVRNGDKKEPTDFEKANPDRVSFSYTSPRIKKLLTTEGEILEVFIYYELLRSGYFDDVACSYEFKWEDGGVKNEIDCILVKGFRTVIIECKATHTLKLDYYHKLHSIADHFGIGATKILVGNTYRDSDEQNEQRNDIQRSRGRQLNIITISDLNEIENIAEVIRDMIEQN